MQWRHPPHMRDLRIRVCYPAVNNPPWLMWDGRNTATGLLAEIVELLAKEFDWRLEYVSQDISGFLSGEMDFTQSASAAMDADLCDFGTMYATIPGSLTHVSNTSDFVWPFTYTHVGVAIAKERDVANLWRMFEPFEPNLWFAIVCTVFMVAFMLSILQQQHGGDTRATPRERLRRWAR
eukprot:4267201-Prymnesium_polylepis.1